MRCGWRSRRARSRSRPSAMRCRVALGVTLLVPQLAVAQGRGGQAAPAGQTATLLVPARVWEGTDAAPRGGWAVLVRGDRIESVGPLAAMNLPAGAPTIDL